MNTLSQFDTKTEVFTMTKNVALAMRFQRYEDSCFLHVPTAYE